MTTHKRKLVRDPVSGEAFLPVHESALARRAAVTSGLLLLAYFAGLLLLLFDVWSGQNRALRFLRFPFQPGDPRLSGIFKFLAYAFIGGGLGAVVNEIRSFLRWHAELESFGARFIWKTAAAPWVGGTLALLVVALLRSGLAAVGGTSGATGTAGATWAFAIGSLTGYGSHDASKWLDRQVRRLFSQKASASGAAPSKGPKH